MKLINITGFGISIFCNYQRTLKYFLRNGNEILFMRYSVGVNSCVNQFHNIVVLFLSIKNLFVHHIEDSKAFHVVALMHDAARISRRPNTINGSCKTNSRLPRHSSTKRKRFSQLLRVGRPNSSQVSLAFLCPSSDLCRFAQSRELLCRHLRLRCSTIFVSIRLNVIDQYISPHTIFMFLFAFPLILICHTI